MRSRDCGFRLKRHKITGNKGFLKFENPDEKWAICLNQTLAFTIWFFPLQIDNWIEQDNLCERLSAGTGIHRFDRQRSPHSLQNVALKILY